MKYERAWKTTTNFKRTLYQITADYCLISEKSIGKTPKFMLKLFWSLAMSRASLNTAPLIEIR